VFYEKKTMKKEIFDHNMAAIKANVESFKIEDSLRVFASVCNFVNGAFLRPDEIRDSKLAEAFKSNAEQRYKKLVERYGVRDRSSFVQAMLQDFGMDEDIAIKLTRGKFEVEQTIQAMFGEIELE